MSNHTGTYARIERVGVAIAALVGGLVGISTAVGQSSDSVTVEVGDCARLPSPDERLACYESRVDAVLRARGREPTAAEPQGRSAETQPPAETQQPADSPTDAGAREVDRSAQKRNDAVAATGAEATAEGPPARQRAERSRSTGNETIEQGEVVGRIAAVRETVPNSYVVTLDNGQVWRQTTPKWYPLRPGQPVTIHPPNSRWGSASRLTVEEMKGFIQVERIR